MNTAKASAIELAKGGGQGAPAGGVQVGVAPPFVYLDAVAAGGRGFDCARLGRRMLYFEKSGAFTGEISAEMLKDIGVQVLS